MVKIVKCFTARDVQHECDHLDGITFLEKVIGPNGFSPREMIKKFKLNKM
ncbi:MAG: peptide deformylase [Clostridia bacterium]|nr:peptide deformylase [Clostridia bacterium]